MSLKTLWYMVMAKVIVIGLVIATGLKFFQAGNLTPFIPPARPAPEGDQTVLDAVLGAFGGGTPHVFGVWGLFAAAPAIAFAYIGFDLIATSSEETDDAPRKVPRGILTALLTAIVLYAAVAIALVGMVGMDGFAKLDPDKLLLAAAFDEVGAGAMGKIVDLGAVLALTTVILVVMISLTRVVFSMARDGLLPRPLAAMSRYKVPSRATLLAGGAAVVMSQTFDVLTLEQLVVIGTLFAFLFVAAAVLALRHSQPDLHRPFRMPAAPLIVIATILAVGWLMLNLKVETWAYFAIWMAFGLVLYLVYGRRKSQMKLLLDEPPAPPVSARLGAAPPPGALPPESPGSLPPGVVPVGGPVFGEPAFGEPGLGDPVPYEPGGWPGERRPGTPESPYPTGRYSTGRQPGGQFAREPYQAEQPPPGRYERDDRGRTPGPYSSGSYGPGRPADPYAVDPGVPNPYATGPYATGPYDSGDQDRGEDDYGEDPPDSRYRR
jgi:APA family basic amino acid/polyamine antiporter